MSTPAGMLSRETPWNPSQPAMTSHSMVMLAPSSRKLTDGCSLTRVVQLHLADLEQDRVAGSEADRDQVLDDLLLSVHGDAASAGELAEVDAVVGTAEAQADAVMHQTLAAHPLASAGGVEQIRAALFEHAGAHALLDVRPRARLDHDRLDALEAQQMREHQPGGTCPDDRDLRAHAEEPPRTGTDGGRAAR